MILATEPKPSVRDEVERKITEGECLQCGDKSHPGFRGLCGPHYWAWYRGRGGLDDIEKQKRDAKLIRDGKLLKSRQGRRLQQREAS